METEPMASARTSAGTSPAAGPAVHRAPGAEPGRPLVVDLDGTLARSDLTVESLLQVVTRAPLRLPYILAGLRQGRSGLKSRLAESADLACDLIPYEPSVIALAEARKAEGSRIILCTASHASIANAVKGQLPLIDEAHGSGPGRNLKGRNKASFLVDRFGIGGYDYVGDARADLPVWENAHTAYVVEAGRVKPGLVRSAGNDVLAVPVETAGIRTYLRLMRPHQWSKNLLVFVPALAAQMLDPGSLISAGLAFVAFCLVASGIYIVNDLLDLEADRAHPRKRSRPLASGQVPVAHAIVLAAVLLALGALSASLVGQPWFVAILALYLALTTAYSFWLKRKLLVDVFVLAGLYTLRVIGGATAVEGWPSVWLMGFSIFIFLSLAAVKRQAELEDVKRAARGEIKGRAYAIGDLPIIRSIALTSGYVAVLLFALYVNSDTVRELYNWPMLLILICPLLLFWVTRMVMVTHRGRMHDDPIVFASRDWVSLVVIGLVVAVVVLAAVLPVNLAGLD